jgi:hypothetical protein
MSIVRPKVVVVGHGHGLYVVPAGNLGITTGTERRNFIPIETGSPQVTHAFVFVYLDPYLSLNQSCDAPRRL